MLALVEVAILMVQGAQIKTASKSFFLAFGRLSYVFEIKTALQVVFLGFG